MNLPAHLAQDQALGIIENEIIAQYEIGSMKNFNYLILDWKNRVAAIVDPQKDLSQVLGDLSRFQFTLQSILLTHTHHDHIAGVKPLLEKNPNLIVRTGKADAHRIDQNLIQKYQFQYFQDGESFLVGELSWQALHTPGHSAGEFCFYYQVKNKNELPYLFTGDTIFIRDCGRTDFESGSNEEMFASIQRIKILDPNTVFLVGHHYAKECATQLKTELLSSPPFRFQSVEELASFD